MENAEEILVIILSSALAVFLILSIFIAYKLIGLIRTLQNLADKAEHVAEAAESMSATIKKAAEALSITKIFASIAKSFSNRNDDHKERKKGG